MTRALGILGLALLLACALAAQTPGPPPPAEPTEAPVPDESGTKAKESSTPPDTTGLKEEDESLTTAKEYSFNPLQADKEMKVGEFYAKKKSWRAAANRFSEASKWNPGLAQAFLRLGEMREKLRDPEGARDAYQKYIELAPDTKEAHELSKKLGKRKGGKPAPASDSKAAASHDDRSPGGASSPSR